MPRALHDESCESSFAQRPAQMRAGFVQAVQLAAHLEHRIFPPVPPPALCAFRWNVLLRRQPAPHGITSCPRLKNATSARHGRPGQLSPQESNRSLPGELGCRRIIRVRSVFLEKPVLCPRVCVERDVLPTGCAEDLLEILHDGGGFKFVRLSEMSEKGRSDPGIDAISRPQEEDDRSHIHGEFLRQPKPPKSAQGKPKHSKAFSPYS